MFLTPKKLYLLKTYLMARRKSGLFKIPINNLILDQYNPRLYGESEKDSQEEIMAKIYQKEQIEEVASSLAVNGYFEEEPIIVVPENQSDFDKITNDNISQFKFTVIEGNRRTTSVKLLLSKNKIVDEDFPKIINDTVRNGLENLPAIIYEKREDVDIYLSVRHISGNRKWDAYAKAKYIYETVNKTNLVLNDLNKAIDSLSTQIGDQSNIVKKYYVYFKLFKEIEDNVAEYSSKHIKDRFSLLEVSIASGNTTIADYLGIQPFKRINLEDDLIKPNKVENLQDVTEWVFGRDEYGTGSVINDSRQISALLKPVLGNKEATEHLKQFDDLAGAYELSNGEQDFIIGNINKANKLISNILNKANKYKTIPEFQTAISDFYDTVENFKKILK